MDAVGEARDVLGHAVVALRALTDGLDGGSSVDELLDLIDVAGSVRRAADTIVAMAAGELRSLDTATTSLHSRLGYRSLPELVADRAGVDRREASMLCSVGAATTPTMSLLGEHLPARHPHVSAALRSGAVDARTADAAVRGLAQVKGRLDPAALDELEQTVVWWAAELGERDFARLCRSLPDQVEPEGVEERERRMRAAAGLFTSGRRHGMTRWTLVLHPEAEGALLAALDARTAPRRVRFKDSDDVADGDMDDRRELPARRLDALVDIARESLRADDGRVAGTSVTMLVTVSEEALRTGIGTATIAGVEAPICAGTARRLAADAEIIPVVLGGASEILDLGVGQRLFSRAQRRALAVRDGGCIWPECDAPPDWCEVAHLVAWARWGPTDLDNGALMCSFHHRQFDTNGWQLLDRGGVRYLVPPPWVDATRRPRRAGRLPDVA